MKNLFLSKNINLSSIKITIVKCILNVIALYASSQITIPLKPVPITLQTTIVLLIALTSNTKDAVISVGMYLLLGLLGLPIFSGGAGGIKYFFGPTLGYLIGFLLVAFLISTLKNSEKLPFLPQSNDSNRFYRLVYLCLLGQITLFLCGVSWLASYIGFENAVYYGFIVFIPSGLAKTFILSASINLLTKNKSA